MSNKQSAKRLLQNLKTYKLACNDVNPIEVESYRKLYGNDEGRILGALMTIRNTTDLHTNESPRQSPPLSHRKRKRRRRNKHKQQKKRTDAEGEEIQQQETTTCHTGSDPCTSSCLPQTHNRLVEYSSDSSIEETDNQQRFELPMFLRESTTHTIPASPDPPPQPPVVHHTLDSDSDSGHDYFNTAGADSSSSSGEDHTMVPKPLLTHQSTDTISSGLQLSTHVCYKCGKIGHMSSDCLVVSSRNRQYQPYNTNQQPHGVKVLVSKCRKLKNDKNASCSVCGVHSNLANCLDCGLNICDGRGHLVKHLLDHPSHVTLFSYKLGKIVKCCKPSCGVVNCYQLLMCSNCFSKIFSQHYSMITATWSVTGLKAISNLLCCDEHFEWHRMNCSTSSNEFFVSEEKMKTIVDGTLSDFVF